MSAVRSRIAALLPPRVKDRLFKAQLSGLSIWRLLRRHRSKFVSGYLDGLKGVEIGASSHNRFYLDAINVDRYPERNSVYAREQRRLVMHAAKIDVVAPGDDLPFGDDAYDFVFSSHVIEHFPDPLKALYEWIRVARRVVVVVAPHRDRNDLDAGRPLTSVAELVERHRRGFASPEDRHWSVWTCESFLEMCARTGLAVIDRQDPDDKVGNGFTVVIDAARSSASLPTGAA